MKKTGFLAFAFVATLQLAPRPAHAGLFSVSPDKERKIGADASAQIEKGAPIVTGPVADWVERVGSKLAAVSDPEFKYSFHVIDSPEINAFCLPGGYVYVYTGLRKVVKTDDELAAVLAHEITHAEQHHYAKQYKKSSTRGTILGVGSILLGVPYVAQQVLSIVDASFTQKYSRSSEYEADHDGAIRMKRAGFNPNAMVSVLQRLADEDDTNNMDQWMSDHPEGKKRVKAIQALLPTLGTGNVSPTTLTVTRDTSQNR